MMHEIVWAPLVNIWLVGALAGLMAAVVGAAIWRGLSGWWLRGLAAAAALLALANPSLQSEDRTPLSDIVILVVDETASQKSKSEAHDLEVHGPIRPFVLDQAASAASFLPFSTASSMVPTM